MGISPFALQMFLNHKKRGLFAESQSIIQLGRQDIYNSQLCNQIFSLEGISGLPEKLTDIDFFSALGFSEVFSVDASDYENSTYIHDLNLPIDKSMENKFDCIFDGGTIEHVFNTPQVFKNIFSMLKPGGLIIHSSPSNNHVDHGFYQFSPTLFWDYYSANEWEIKESLFFEYQRQHDSVPWKWYVYSPGSLDPISFGGLGNSCYGVWFVARKTEKTVCERTPQQGRYANHAWK